MSESRSRADASEDEAVSIPALPIGSEAEGHLAWEEIEVGRYMPRRIRGSFRGRELG